MADDIITDGMLDMFIFETEQGLENLQNICLDSKDIGEFDEDNVNEIFRIMHTIKGASAVMMYQNIATLSHKLEDVFYFIRENNPENVPHEELVDDVLEVSDFITNELEKIKEGSESDGDSTGLIEILDVFLKKIQNVTTGENVQPIQERPLQEKPHFYIAPVASEHSKFYNIFITGIAEDILFTPDDIIANPASSDVIHEFGFKIALQTTEGPDKIMELINSSAGIENVEINECTGEEFLAFCAEAETPAVNPDAQAAPAPAAAVNVPAANATAPVNTPASPAEKPAANATPQPAPATAQTETKPKRPPAKKG